jgi:hypothetical protein
VLNLSSIFNNIEISVETIPQNLNILNSNINFNIKTLANPNEITSYIFNSFVSSTIDLKPLSSNQNISFYNSHIYDETLSSFDPNQNFPNNLSTQATTYFKYANYAHTHKKANPLYEQYSITSFLTSSVISSIILPEQNVVNKNLLNGNNNIQFGTNIRFIFNGSQR